MFRLFCTAAVAALGLATFVASAAAGEHGRSESQHYGFGRYRSYGGHEFRPSNRFDYGRYGYRSFSWTHSRWSDYYHCYCYWAPGYGWCFYEPHYSYYLPVSSYFDVYPEVTRTGPAPVLAPPTAIQQTSVVVGAPTLPSVPVPPVAPVPTTVQQTKVLVAPSPGAELPSGPGGPVGPTAPTGLPMARAGAPAP
jgi:hypothetical protein